MDKPMLTRTLKTRLIALFPEAEKAVKELTQAEVVETSYALGMAAYEVGQLTLALDHLVEALHTDGHRRDLWLTIGRIHLAQSQFDSAEGYLQHAHTLESDETVNTLLGDVALGRKDFDSAEHYYREATRLNTQFTDGFIKLAQALLGNKRHLEATKALEKALYLDRKAVVANYYLAQICFEQKDYQRAMVQLHLVKTLKPDYAPAYVMLADIFERIRDYKQAVIELKKVVSLKQANGTVHFKLGKIQLGLQNREAALAHFVEAKTLDTTCFDAYYHAAVLQEGMNYLEPALANYEVLLATRKYRETAQMAVMRLRTLLADMKSTMEGSETVEAAPRPVAPAPIPLNRSVVTPFRGTGALVRTAASPD